MLVLIGMVFVAYIIGGILEGLSKIIKVFK